MVESWKVEHRRVASRPFEWTVSRDCFTPFQQRELENWGSWLRALSDRSLAPATEQQARFVRATNDEDRTTTWWEALWRRYLTLEGSRRFVCGSAYLGVGGPSGILRRPCKLELKDCSGSQLDERAAREAERTATEQEQLALLDREQYERELENYHTVPGASPPGTYSDSREDREPEDDEEGEEWECNLEEMIDLEENGVYGGEDDGVDDRLSDYEDEEDGLDE